ncbi:MAG: hypothetical protein NTV49_06210 [Kiritimatiellaeota bacterium]|nr:hypothetical protein [Kiritimatiellota bacterium]
MKKPLVAPALKADRFEWPRGQTASNELWLLADTVQFAGAAARGLFLQCREAHLTGEFHRDVWALADSITFSGAARQSVRLAARREVQIEGRVASGLMVVADTIHLNASSAIGEDAVLLAPNISTEGEIQQKLVAIGNRVTIGGRIGGNCRIGAEEIVIMPGAEIQGDLVYTASKELFLDNQVKLHGKLIRQPTIAWPVRWPQVTPLQALLLQASLLLAALLAGLPFMAVFPRFTARAVMTLQQQPNKCLLAGVISLALLLMLGGLSVVTWVGIPLGLLLLSSCLVLLYLAKLPVALLLGGRLLRGAPAPRPRAALPLLALGLLLLYLAAFLPVVGWLVWVLTVFYGMGAMVLAILSGEREPLPVALPPPREEAPPPPLDGFSP